MKKSLIALLHVGYWFAYLLVATAFLYLVLTDETAANSVGDDMMVTIFIFMVLLPAVVTFYTIYLLLFPRYFGQKQYGRAFWLGGAVSLGASLFGLLVVGGLFFPGCMAQAEPVELGGFVGVVSFLNLLGGVVAFVLRGFSTWFDEVKLKEELQEKNHAMELALVKSQLDPHFLFNTINNIDVLILKDPEEASDYLNRLSDIIRFMLYETKTKEIGLGHEIAYLEKYIALQKIRTANASYVDFRVTGSSAGRKVAPMLFIPFIENAFKHTTNKKEEGAIRIRLEITPEHLCLICVNRLELHRTNTFAPGGLGNELIRKRLQLLYPDRHQLDIRREEGRHYHVKLLIHD